MPIKSATEREAGALAGNSGVWSEDRPAELLEPEVAPTDLSRRPLMRVALGLAGGAVVAIAGLALASSTLFAGSSPVLSAKSASSRAHAAVFHGSAPQARDVGILPDLRAASLRLSRNHATTSRARRSKSARTTATRAQVEPVVYHPLAPSTTGPATPTSSSGQPSSPNTSPPAAPASAAAAASQPARPGPNGPLVCISNCG